MIEYAQKSISPEFARSCDFYVADMATIEFPEGSARYVQANSSVQHVARDVLPSLLQSIHTWLIPRGLLYIHYRNGNGERLETSYEYISAEHGGTTRYQVYYSEKEMNSRLTEAGYEILESESYETDYERDDPSKKVTVPKKTRVVARSIKKS